MSEVAGLILAGGRSTRMGGRDKAFCRLGGEMLLARALRRLAPQLPQLAVSAGGDPSRFAGLPWPVLADAAGAGGPLAGVRAGLAWAAGLADPPRHLVTVPVDAPFFPEDLVARLMAAADGPGVLAVAVGAGGRQPVFAAWPLALAAALDAFLCAGETRRVGAFLDRHGARTVVFPPAASGPDPFFNVNTPADLAEAGRLAGPQAPAEN